MSYELYYWDGLQGRGEFVRLGLEAAGADYVDVVRRPEMGAKALSSVLENASLPHIPFAPPILRDGDVCVSHVANILAYLGPRLGLAPQGEADRFFLNGLQLTVTDFVSEVHDTHHPISTADFYEDQKAEARLRAAAFLKHRLPKFFHYFERVLMQNPCGPAFAVGGKLTYVDLSLFQLMEGLTYAFPKAMARLDGQYPALEALRGHVGENPRIAAYLQSARRLPFNEDGLFRHYPELDCD